ncbi:MAG: adaptor protein MecA [Clostridia bacterium]|nr:adaptor protein MecA [Clostridia bacterium]
MKIKKITDNRVKVLVESGDISKYRVPYHRLNTADDQSAEFIYQLLLKIKEQTGISFLETSILLEATPTIGGNYYVTITGGNESDGWILQKDNEKEEELRIFCLENPKDLPDAAKLFVKYPALLPESSALYKYAGRYYCVLEFSSLQMAHKDFSPLTLQLAEYMIPCKGSPENEGILLERGQMISPLLFKNE